MFSMLNSIDHDITTPHKNLDAVNKDVILHRALRWFMYPANQCKNINICWDFNIYKQNEFHTQLN